MSVLTEQQAHEARVLAEGEACTCDVMTLVDRIGGGMSDDQSDYLVCQRCGRGEVVTTWASRPDADVRPFTMAERARYAQ